MKLMTISIIARSGMKCRGVALVTALALLTILAVLATCFAVLLMIEIESSRVAQGRVQSDMLARSGIEHAMSLLRQDTVEQPGWDDPTEGWRTQLANKDGKGIKWLYVRSGTGKVIGRYAVEIEDEAGKINVNAASAASEKEQNQGVGTFEILLGDGKGRGLPLGVDSARRIVQYRYGADGKPGRALKDDNLTAARYQNDEIDNNSNGLVDEPGEGVDEPGEYLVHALRGDDRAFLSVEEMIGTCAKGEPLNDRARLVLKQMATVQSRSQDVYWDRRENAWQNRVNINVADKSQLVDLLTRANAEGKFEPSSKDVQQLAANIQDYRDQNHVLTTAGNEYGVEAVCFNEVLANDMSMTFLAHWCNSDWVPDYGFSPNANRMYWPEGMWGDTGQYPSMYWGVQSLASEGSYFTIKLVQPTSPYGTDYSASKKQAMREFWQMELPWPQNLWNNSVVRLFQGGSEKGRYNVVTSYEGMDRRVTMEPQDQSSRDFANAAIGAPDVYCRIRNTWVGGWGGVWSEMPRENFRGFFPVAKRHPNLECYYRGYMISGSRKKGDSSVITELDVDGDTRTYRTVKEDERARFAIKNGEALKPNRFGFIDVLVTSSAECSAQRKFNYDVMLFTRPDIVELMNVSDKPISLRNWRVVMNTGMEATTLATIDSATHYSEALRGLSDDPNPTIEPRSYAYLTNNREIFAKEWCGVDEDYGNRNTERLPVIELPEMYWGITYNIVKVVRPYELDVEGANWKRNQLMGEVMTIIAERNSGEVDPNGITHYVRGNLADKLFKDSGGQWEDMGVKPGDRVMILGLPRAGGFVSFTLKNEYEQVAARTLEYGTVDTNQFGYSTQKYDPTHYTWVASPTPSIGGTVERARNNLDIRPNAAQPHIKNNDYVSPAEMQHVRRSKDWENVGGQNLAVTRIAFKAIGQFVTVSGVRLDPEEEGTHIAGWKPAFGTVQFSDARTLVAETVNWPPGLWRGQKAKLLSGDLAGEEFSVTNSTMNALQITGLSSGGKVLKAKPGDLFCVGPGYGTAVYYTKQDDDAGEWEWKDKDLVKGTYGLYLFGLNDSITTTEFLEENWNSELEVLVFNFDRREYEPFPIDRIEGGSMYRVRGRSGRFQYGKSDGVFCGMIGPEHISAYRGIKLKLIPHGTGQQKCSGFAWFDYVYLAPGRTEGKINVNTASAEVLRALPGMTEEVAQNIERGLGYGDMGMVKPYKHAAEILDVQGMTPEIFERICNLITASSEQYRVKVVGQTLTDTDGTFDEKKGDKVIAESRMDVVLDRSQLMRTSGSGGSFLTLSGR